MLVEGFTYLPFPGQHHHRPAAKVSESSRRILGQGDRPSSDRGDVGAKDAEILTLVCPHCGNSFPSAMEMDPTTFAAIRLQSMLETCAACSLASRFQKNDYGFRPASV